MGCTSSKQTQASAGSSAGAASKTLLQSATGNKRQVAVAESGRFDQLAAAATAAEKKISKVADSEMYATAVESTIAVEVAPTSKRQEAWALCDAAWARALEKGNKAEKSWPSLPQLEQPREESEACQKTQQQLGAEDAGGVSQGELELDDIPQYPANGTAPSRSHQHICTVMPGVGGIACDVDEDESDQAVAESVADDSKELKLPEAKEDVQKTAVFSVFGFSLFAMCASNAEEVAEEFRVADPNTSEFKA